ncbi:MAG: hypothetical protein ACFE0Q_18220 [Anaerolineae bacterium]
MQAIPPADALMPHMNFDQGDLIANRSGQLGEGQRAHLNHLKTRALLIGVVGFFSFAFVATVFLFFGSENSWLVMTLIGMFITFCNAIFVGLFARQYMRLQADLRDSTVQIVSGELERVVKPNRQMNNFVLRIDEQEFYVKKELFQLFRHEVPYRLYRTRHSRVLLSAEPIP